MKSRPYRRSAFLLLLILLLLAIIYYQEPALQGQAYETAEFIEDSAQKNTILAELKFIQLILDKVIHLIN